ncbi:RNA polymerase ECF-type sigma factor [Gracilibacillus halophilus YIM-C55.5]|uniref:RNA polymerase ECF-type sigma factor n=1 Tax=Gracilibacillus halophilus YIM-C55.5 TaxID=1308866 RepID=N4WFR2_9BACI|nr:sigma-70 family RNA polymerase sigma factor [Gracilibacillus halophilus]ENH98084.1 RNA polymerase ECF-type sigma factor [Gracilibacillus halophilus YIM-C55.5]
MDDSPSKEYFSELYKKYANFVYRTAYFLTKSKGLADDITHETFIQIIRKYHLYDPSRNIEPWIYKITINITRNVMRKQKLFSVFGKSNITTEQQHIEHTVLTKESNEELWSEIIRLPRKSKEIIILHFYFEYTLFEVANILGIPLGTCKSRLHYGLNKLRNNEQVVKQMIQHRMGGK